MADPTVDGGVLGVKLAVVIAGFAGAVASLSFVRDLSRQQALIAVFTGGVTANYLTPAVAGYFAILHEYEYPTAFVVGVTAMNIIPGLLKLSEVFRRDPRGFLK